MLLTNLSSNHQKRQIQAASKTLNMLKIDPIK